MGVHIKYTIKQGEIEKRLLALYAGGGGIGKLRREWGRIYRGVGLSLVFTGGEKKRSRPGSNPGLWHLQQ